MPTKGCSRSDRGRRTRGAFTLIELLVVIAIIAALAAVLLAIIPGMVDSARARACTRNLASHATALANYNNQEGGMPALFRAADPNEQIVKMAGDPDETIKTGGTGDAVTRAWQIRQTIGGNATQNAWLVIDGGYIGGGQEAYKCPGDTDYAPRTLTDAEISGRDSKYGWKDPKNVSYGFHFPYSAYSAQAQTPDENGEYTQTINANDRNLADPNGKIQVGTAYLNKDMYPANCVYMADYNPLASVSGTYTNNSNHKDGIAVLEKGGSNRFVETSTGRVGDDDLYTNREKTGNVPSPPTAAGVVDEEGWSTRPVTDTMILPFNQRTTE